MLLGDMPPPIRTITKHHHFVAPQNAPPNRLLPKPPAKAVGLFSRTQVPGTVGTKLQVLRTLAIATAAGLVTAAELELTPAARAQMRQHSIHRDRHRANPG